VAKGGALVLLHFLLAYHVLDDKITPWN